MKYIILILIIFIIILLYRLPKFLKKNKSKNKNNVIDLEKDPNSGEYKSKDWNEKFEQNHRKEFFNNSI